MFHLLKRNPAQQDNEMCHPWYYYLRAYTRFMFLKDMEFFQLFLPSIYIVSISGLLQQHNALIAGSLSGAL